MPRTPSIPSVAIAAAVPALLLALPAPSGAATTIGANLNAVEPTESLVCDPCTAVQRLTRTRRRSRG